MHLEDTFIESDLHLETANQTHNVANGMLYCLSNRNSTILICLS